MAVRPLIPTIAARAVPDWVGGRIGAGIATFAREAGARAMRHAWAKTQTHGSRGRHQTVEGGEALSRERLPSPPERSIRQRLGVNQARRWAARARLILAQPRHQGAWLVSQAEAVEDRRVDGTAGGDKVPLRVVLGRVVDDFSEAKFVKQACDEAPMIQDLAAVAVLSIH
jgi:hypothetical protein